MSTSSISNKLPPSKTPIWVRATGSRITRAKKARAYLRKHAWVPTCPEERYRALLVIACNLRLYHLLPYSLSFALIDEHLNPRVLGIDGTPCPFSEEEVRNHYQKAQQRGMYPTLGVSDSRAKKKMAALVLNKEIKSFLRKCTIPGGSCTPESLLNTFIAFRGGEAINRIVFGRAVVAATGIRRSTPFGVPTYKGFHISTKVRTRRTAARTARFRDRSGVK